MPISPIANLFRTGHSASHGNADAKKTQTTHNGRVMTLETERAPTAKDKYIQSLLTTDTSNIRPDLRARVEQRTAARAHRHQLVQNRQGIVQERDDVSRQIVRLERQERSGVRGVLHLLGLKSRANPEIPELQSKRTQLRKAKALANEKVRAAGDTLKT